MDREDGPGRPTEEELELFRRVAPGAQFEATVELAEKSEEKEFFVEKIREIAAAVRAAPGLGGSDGSAEHPVVLRYFHPGGTETLVCEIGDGGEAFGYQVLNGDYQNSEWGYLSIDELREIPLMELDYHMESGMSVERWLYGRSPGLFPEYAGLSADVRDTAEAATANPLEGMAVRDISTGGTHVIPEPAEQLRRNVRHILGELENVINDGGGERLSVEEVRRYVRNELFNMLAVEDGAVYGGRGEEVCGHLRLLGDPYIDSVIDGEAERDFDVLAGGGEAERDEKPSAVLQGEVLVAALEALEAPFEEAGFTRDSYRLLFPTQGTETPLGTVRIPASLFAGVAEEDGRVLMPAVRSALADPDIVVEERRTEADEIFGGTAERELRVYVKVFADGAGARTAVSVSVSADDGRVSPPALTAVRDVVDGMEPSDRMLYVSGRVGREAERLVEISGRSAGSGGEEEYGEEFKEDFSALAEGNPSASGFGRSLLTVLGPSARKRQVAAIAAENGYGLSSVRMVMAARVYRDSRDGRVRQKVRDLLEHINHHSEIRMLENGEYRGIEEEYREALLSDVLAVSADEDGEGIRRDVERIFAELTEPELDAIGQDEEAGSRSRREESEAATGTGDTGEGRASRVRPSEIRERCRKILEKGDDEITDDDKIVLAQYEGAGGLHEAGSSASGVLNEFYTPKNLVDKVWALADAYAPGAVTVLEPSAGTGRFADGRHGNRFTMHEMDGTSARINRLLHPDAEIVEGAFQRQFFDDSGRFRKTDYEQPRYDVVIGNPPYGEHTGRYRGLGEGAEFDRYEEYFIARGLDSLKNPGSDGRGAVLAFVVPSGFLNSRNDNAKRAIAGRGFLLDAYRLPEGVFPTTRVGTDIVLMARWGEEAGPDARQVEAAAELMSDGTFFGRNPRKVLGEERSRSNRFGREERYVAVREGLSVQDELDRIDGFLGEIRGAAAGAHGIPEGGIHAGEPAEASPRKARAAGRAKKRERPVETSEGGVMTAGEFARLYGRDFDEREFPIWRATDWEGMIDIRLLGSADVEFLEESGKYVQERPGRWTHKILFTTGDVSARLEEQRELLAAAEDGGDRELHRSNVELLEGSMNRQIPLEEIHFGVQSDLAENLLVGCPREDGGVDRLNLQEAFILWAQNRRPDTQEYRGSIDFATANISREDFPRNVGWRDIVEYIDKRSVKAERTSSWAYGMSKEDIAQLKRDRRKEAEEKRQSRSDTANALFDRFIHEGLEEGNREELVREYNRRFNSYVQPDYSKLPLFVEGMSLYKGRSRFRLYDQQIKGISFLCNKGNGMLAYDVGVGKTAAGIVATVNQIGTGRSLRPLIVVPNQVYGKWYTDIRQLFPNMKVNDLFNMNDASALRYVNADNPHKLDIPERSITLVTEQALEHITFTDETCGGELLEDFTSLLSVDPDSADNTDRENAAQKEKVEQVIGAASRTRDGKFYFFEECGFDHLTVDEAHRFKNLWVKPRPRNRGESNEYAGIPGGVPSKRALKMFAMTQIVQRRNNDRNVFMLTATPFTNSPLEVYSMLTYVGRERLKRAGIGSLRDFLNEFAQTKIELGVNSRGEIDTRQVMKNWRQLGSLQGILTEFIDKVDGEEAGIIRPKKFTHVKPLDMSELQSRMCRADELRMEDVKRGNSAAVLQAMTNMRIAMVAPALANPLCYPDIDLPPMDELVETSPKLKFVCDSIVGMYRDNPDKGQFMYLPLGKEAHGVIKDYLVGHGIPADAVEIINGELNNTPDRKDRIAAMFNDRNDRVKVLVGGQNTAEGMDLNGNTFVMYNCSLGWNPSETVQAEGRIWRQGNLQGHVHIVYPLMNDSIDSVLYQKHDEKRSRIGELWSYKGDTLNVEDINPEELKIELIKDPEKRSRLILDERTKDMNAELSRVRLRITTYNEIAEKERSLRAQKETIERSVREYERLISEMEANGSSAPGWTRAGLNNDRKNLKRIEDSLVLVGRKLEKLGVHDAEESAAYIRELNRQRKEIESAIREFEEKELPAIIARMKEEQARRREVEYPVEIQRRILEADILGNLRPVEEVEHDVVELRRAKLVEAAQSAEEAMRTEEDGVVEPSGTASAEPDAAAEGEGKPEKGKDGAPGKGKARSGKKERPGIYEDEEGLFFGLADDAPVLVGSPVSEYFNGGNDDRRLTSGQLTESELERDRIVVPVLDGAARGMYKAFNEFAERGVFDIQGGAVDLEDGRLSGTGWLQLQAAMSIYRSKMFETMRYVLIDRERGEIRDQLAVRSYMPNRCAVSMPDADTVRQVVWRAEETDSLVVLVHNHPSGDIEASDYDMMFTQRFENLMRRVGGADLFAGHLILDHGTFSVYRPEKGWTAWRNLEPEDVPDRLDNGQFMLRGTRIDRTDMLVGVGERLNGADGWSDEFIPVVFSDGQNNVTGVSLYDRGFFAGRPERIRDELWLSGAGVRAARIFPVITVALAEKLGPREMSALEERLKGLVIQDTVTDAVLADTTVTEKFGMSPGRPSPYGWEERPQRIDMESTWGKPRSWRRGGPAAGTEY